MATDNGGVRRAIRVPRRLPLGCGLRKSVTVKVVAYPVLRISHYDAEIIVRLRGRTG